MIEEEEEVEDEEKKFESDCKEQLRILALHVAAKIVQLKPVLDEEEKNYDDEIISESFRNERRTVALDAATVGQLTRLSEKTVECVAEEKHDTDETWEVKNSSQIETIHSSHFQIINEAAALGQIKGFKAHEVCNWDTKAEKAQLARGPKIDRRRMMVRRVSTLVTNFVEEQKIEKPKSWEAEAALVRLEEMEESRKCFTPAEGHGWKKEGLPSPVVPKFQKQVCFLTKKKMHEKVAEEAALKAEIRYHRLRKGRTLKVTGTCTCVYCENPSPFQTSSYRNLKISQAWTDVSVEGEGDVFHPRTHISSQLTMEAVREAKKASTIRRLNKVKSVRLGWSNRKHDSASLPSYVSPMSSRNFLPNPNHKAGTKPKWMQNRLKLTKPVIEPSIKTESSSSSSSSTPEWVSPKLRKTIAIPQKTEVQKNIPSWVSPGLRTNSLPESKKGQLPPWVSSRGPKASHGSNGPINFSPPFGGDEAHKSSSAAPNACHESIGATILSLPFGDDNASSPMNITIRRTSCILPDDLLSPAPRLDDADDEEELFWLQMARSVADLKLPPTPLDSE
jgi:hypothetical protein